MRPDSGTLFLTVKTSHIGPDILASVVVFSSPEINVSNV